MFGYGPCFRETVRVIVIVSSRLHQVSIISHYIYLNIFVKYQKLLESFQIKEYVMLQSTGKNTFKKSSKSLRGYRHS